LKEKLDRERRRNNDLAIINEGLIEDRRDTIAEDRYKKSDNYLA